MSKYSLKNMQNHASTEEKTRIIYLSIYNTAEFQKKLVLDLFY